MSSIIVDTNVLSALFSGQKYVFNTLANYDEILVPFAVVAELLSGYKAGERYDKNKKIIDEFLRDSSVTVIYPNEKTVQIYSDFYAYLRKQGTPIPTNDIWIASIAYQQSLTLYTFDSDFNNLPQLMILK